MTEINYSEKISELNFLNVWLPRRISLIISQEQYIALLKGYQPHWDMRYGIIYDQKENYFYAYRSGFVVGKYKAEKLRDGGFEFTEMFENKLKNDYLVIFDCVIEACNQNGVECDRLKMMEWSNETISLNTSREIIQTPDLGPQSPSDNTFTSKARKLQSMWRVQNGLDIGIGPNKNSVNLKTGLPTYYGNMIKDGEHTGRNFFYPKTFEYAKWRVNTKLKDETIDEYRLFNNLMSSMPMAFNLFHPLMMLHVQHPMAADKMIQNAFPAFPIFKVTEIGLEFIPTPKENYTGDKSAIDAFIRFQDEDGNDYLIAIETKYTVSLGKNTASEKVFQKQLAIISELDMFTPESADMILQKKLSISQIFRNFILAEKYERVHGLCGVYSVIMAPENHPTTKEEVNLLKSHLKEEYKKRVFELTIEDFAASIHRYCPDGYQQWVDWFEDRYLNFTKIQTNIIQ